MVIQIISKNSLEINFKYLEAIATPKSIELLLYPIFQFNGYTTTTYCSLYCLQRRHSTLPKETLNLQLFIKHLADFLLNEY